MTPCDSLTPKNFPNQLNIDKSDSKHFRNKSQMAVDLVPLDLSKYK